MTEDLFSRGGSLDTFYHFANGLILFTYTVKAIAVYFHKDEKTLKFPKSTSRLQTGSEQVSKVKENLINNSDEFSFN